MQNKVDKQLRQLNGKRRRQSLAVRKFFKRGQVGFWTSKAMNDHAIDNIVKIDKIDSANNELK